MTASSDHSLDTERGLLGHGPSASVSCSAFAGQSPGTHLALVSKSRTCPGLTKVQEGFEIESWVKFVEGLGQKAGQAVRD